jgi:CheY-like chemotaxis protein
MPGKLNKRCEKRVLCNLDATINGIIKVTVLDISESGMYIHTQAEFIKGTTLEMKVDIDKTPVSMRAAVRHSQPGIGIGVRFVNLSARASSLVKEFLERSPSLTKKEGEKEAKKILLVDDNEQSRVIYRNKLSMEGFTVVDASNGVEALKRLHEHNIDIVVLDIWMEGVDGFRVLQLMRLNPALKNIPVVVLSARSVPADIQKAIALGARDYLPKMVTTPLKLADKVKEVLARSG